MSYRIITLVALVLTMTHTLPASAQAKRIVAPPGAGVPGRPFSPAVRSGDFLYVAGQMATDAQGKLVGNDIATQTRTALENVRAILAADGMGMGDVVSATVFLSDFRLFDAMNTVYREFFSTNPPVRATVEASLALQGGLIEVAVIAARPGVDKEIIEPQGWAGNPRPYSRAIRVGDHLFVAGITAQDPRTGRGVDGDIATQTRQVLENVKTLVETAGFKLSDMNVSRVWLGDARDFQGMNDVYRTYFAAAPPTRVTVRSTSTKVEIMVSGTRGPKQILGTQGGTTPLSQAIKVGNTLHVSGIIRGTPELRGDVKGQTRAVLEQIRGLLQQGGMDFGDVVTSAVWLSDIRDYASMNEVYREFFTQAPPSRATVQSMLMSTDGLVEIAVTAAK